MWRHWRRRRFDWRYGSRDELGQLLDLFERRNDDDVDIGNVLDRRHFDHGHNDVKWVNHRFDGQYRNYGLDHNRYDIYRRNHHRGHDDGFHDWLHYRWHDDRLYYGWNYRRHAYAAVRHGLR